MTTDKTFDSGCRRKMNGITVKCRNESRFACLWEYFRCTQAFDKEDPSKVVDWIKRNKGAKEAGTDLKTASYLCSRARDLAMPYMTIDKIIFKELSVEDIADPKAFVKKLIEHTTPVSQFLWESLSATTRHRLHEEKRDVTPATLEALVTDFRSVF